MKRQISLIVVSALLLPGCLCPMHISASDYESYIYREAFDEYATNYRPDNVIGSVENRVIENGAKNKAMLLSGKETISSFMIEGAYDTSFIIEMDVNKLSNYVIGDYLSVISDSATVRLLYSDEYGLKLSDGRPTSAYFSSTSMTHITARVNLEKQKYDLYINERCVADSYPLGTNIKTVNGARIQLINTEDSENSILIDNVFVYNGKEIRNKKKLLEEYNGDALTWPNEIDEEVIPFEKVYLEDFESYELGSSVIKETTVSQKNDNNNNFIRVESSKTNKYLRYYRHTTDPLLDFICTSKANDLVAEAAFYPASITGSGRFVVTFIGKNAVGSFPVLYIDSSGQITLNDGTSVGRVNMREWNKITFIFRQSKREYDICVNDKLLTSGVKFGTSTFPYLEKIRFTATGSGIVDFSVDTVAVYTGNKPVSNLNEYIKEMYASYHFMSESEVLELCDDMLVFSTNNEVHKAIVNGKLILVESKPIQYDDLPYLPEELISIEGYKISDGKAYIRSETVEGTKIQDCYYYPADKVASALNKKLFSDLSGFSIISDDADSYYADWSKYWEIKLLLQYETPSREEIYDRFKKHLDTDEHPRLLINSDDIGRLRGEMEFDELKKSMFEKLVVQANNDLLLSLPQQVLHDGVRMAIHDYRAPVIRLAFVYLMTGDMKYAQKAKDIVLTEAAFTNWNPSIHYLDTGVAGTTVAIGYDWLYDLYTPAEREIIQKGLTQNMLNPAYSGLYNGEYMNFPRKTGTDGPAGNWQAICMSGAILAALAVMETNPEYCSNIIEGSLRNFQYMMPSFEPDGAWEEGVGYWGYTNEFCCYIFESLKASCGTYFGFYDVPGYRRTAYFPYDINGSVGAFNFGDADDEGASAADFCVSWHGYVQDNPDFYSLRYKELENGAQPHTIDLLYLNSEKCKVDAVPPLDSYYRGINSGSMRSEFFNTAATYVGYHCGKNTAGHNHYETGEFIFDSLGVRWALDLGKDNYNLNTYNAHQDTAVYRIRTEGHNCYVINPDEHAGQNEYNSGDRVLRTESNDNSSLVVMDISEAYEDSVKSAKRGLKLGDFRNTLQIRDEIDLKKDNSEFYWFMHTKSEVSVEGNTAYLKQNGHLMKFEFTSNQPLTLDVMDAKPLPSSPIQIGQNQNIGIRKLVINGSVSGRLVVNARLSPVIEGVSFGVMPEVPLDQWQLDLPVEGKVKPLLTDLRIDGKRISGFKSERRNYSYLSVADTEKLNVQAFSDEEHTANVSLVEYDGNMSYQALVSEKNNPMQFSLYSVNVKKIENTNIRSGEKFIMPSVYWASAEPQSANGVMNVLDGNLGTRWSANGENYIVYEMDDVETVSALDIAVHEGDKRNQFMTIQVSEDGENYTTVYDNIQSSGETLLPERYEMNDVKAKYVKLICYKTSVGEWNSISEMYVYTK